MTSLWNLPVFRLVATDRCRVAAPWFEWTTGRSAGATLRRRANALERRRLGATRPWELRLAAVLHLLLAMPRVLLALHRWGRKLRSTEHVSYLRQWLDLQACVWRLGLRPQVYYYLGLHRLPRADRSQIIDPAELHHLQRAISPADIDGLENKLRFHERARREGVATVPLLEVWRDGRWFAGDSGEPRRPACDLFIKRASTYSSVGVMGFRFDPLAGDYSDGVRRYTERALTHTLRKSSLGFALLVQPWLGNHPDLRGFSATALCNYRVVTGRQPDGRIETLVAALRFPLGDGLSCAERGLTCCAAVDLATGRLRAGSTKRPGLGWLTRHPVSGRQIEGFAVPRWTELLQLARRAHEAWPEFPFVGWDLADTDAGLIVLEGSCLWGGFLAQMAGSPPLGLTPFASIYRNNLRHRAALPACPVSANV